MPPRLADRLRGFIERKDLDVFDESLMSSIMDALDRREALEDHMKYYDDYSAALQVARDAIAAWGNYDPSAPRIVDVLATLNAVLGTDRDRCSYCHTLRADHPYHGLYDYCDVFRPAQETERGR